MKRAAARWAEAVDDTEPSQREDTPTSHSPEAGSAAKSVRPPRRSEEEETAFLQGLLQDMTTTPEPTPSPPR